MKRTPNKSRGSTRTGEKSGTPQLLEFRPKKTGSAKPKAQAVSPSTNGSVKALKKKTSAGTRESGSKNTLPVPRPLVDIKRSASALKRLQITPEALDEVPRITSILKNADGGLSQVVSAMRLSDAEVIQTFLEKYDSIPKGDLKVLPMEAIALAAGVNAHELMGAAVSALEQQAMSVVRIVAVSSHHKITKARIKYGQMASGERDRTALDTALGLLPSPKGNTFIGKAIFGSGRSVMDQQGAGGAEDDNTPLKVDDMDLDRLFPPANLMQERLVPIRQRMLTEGK